MATEVEVYVYGCEGLINIVLPSQEVIFISPKSK